MVIFLSAIIITIIIITIIIIIIQLAVQVKELQNMLKVAESTIRQLQLDLQASHKELSILQDKDNLKIARDEMKITSLLSRINKFDSDLQLAK